MAIPEAIYELSKILDNPKFEGLGMSRTIPSILGRDSRSDDFVPMDTVENRNWKVDRLAEQWTDRPVLEGKVRITNDFPCINLMIPAFSKRACVALARILEPNGELLPIQAPIGEYFAYNLLTVADVMDYERAAVEFFRPELRSRALSIDRFEFHEDRLQGLTIFRIVQLPNSQFVTQEFVDAVKQHELNGFDFIKVWPFPEGVSWEAEDKERRRSMKKTKSRKS